MQEITGKLGPGKTAMQEALKRGYGQFIVITAPVPILVRVADLKQRPQPVPRLRQFVENT